MLTEYLLDENSPRRGRDVLLAAFCSLTMFGYSRHGPNPSPVGTHFYSFLIFPNCGQSRSSCLLGWAPTPATSAARCRQNRHFYLAQHDALVVADLTGSNPNVMYEVGLRHAVGLPCVHIAAEGSQLPFDVQNYRTVTYDLSSPAKTSRSVELLRKSILETCARDGIPNGGSPVKLWQEIHSALDPELQESQYGSALESGFSIVRKATRGAQPVVRLWGNRGNRETPDRLRFQEIGLQLGLACTRSGMAISCTDLQDETLEYWTLKGVLEAVSAGVPPVPIYLHFNSADTYERGLPGRTLVADLEKTCRLIEIPYPFADTDRLRTLSDEISREQVAPHDARIGSLLQCDAVVLVGGNKSAQHLVQLMSFLDRHHVRAATPLLFIPIPWIDGMSRTAYREYTGIIDDADFVSKIVREKTP